MSRQKPTDISAADLQIALDPEIGGEIKVYASYDPWVIAGQLTQPEENSGVLALEATFDNNADRDFQVVVDRTGMRSDVELVISLNVRFADSTDGVAEATFAVPARSHNQKFSVGQGTAVDLIGTGDDSAKKVKQILGVASVVGGEAGNRFQIVAVPDEDKFFLIGCTDEAGLTLPLGASLAIACGLNASAHVKRGRGEPGQLTVTEKYVDYMHGLGRLNGHFCTAKVEAYKDERVLTERIVVHKWKPMASPSAGEGDDTVTAQAQGNFQEFAVFTAG